MSNLLVTYLDMKRISYYSIVVSTMLLTFLNINADITVKGSDTMVILGQRWAEKYMETHPDVKISIIGGGSGIGLAALQNNQTDICNASRKIKTKEIAGCIKSFGNKPTEYKVALDGLSVYLNEKNPVKKLSLNQLGGIFSGKITNWKEVGGNDEEIIVYSRENSSGTYEFFKEHVLKGKDFYSKAQTMPGTAVVIQAVSNEINGIGYGGAAYASTVTMCAVSEDDDGDAYLPTKENVINGKYPIWRHLYIYVNPKVDVGDVNSYINWILNSDGQSIVSEVGYYPIKQ